MQYTICYHKGPENRVADALSRFPEPNAECVALLVATPTWTQAVADSYKDDSVAQHMITILAVDPVVVSHFSLCDGLLRYKGRLWVGNTPALHRQLLAAVHNSPVGGHSRIPVTLRRAKQLFAWRGMNAAVWEFVVACPVCQQAKPDRSRLPGLLQPLEVPDCAWKVISMDFMEGLPLSGCFNAFWLLLTPSQSMHTSWAFDIPLQQPQWQQPSCNTFTVFMAYPQLLCLTGTVFSQESYGQSCSDCLKWSCA